MQVHTALLFVLLLVFVLLPDDVYTRGVAEGVVEVPEEAVLVEDFAQLHVDLVQKSPNLRRSKLNPPVLLLSSVKPELDLVPSCSPEL